MSVYDRVSDFCLSLSRLNKLEPASNLSKLGGVKSYGSSRY